MTLTLSPSVLQLKNLKGGAGLLNQWAAHNSENHILLYIKL